ncbi:MAG: hypothetical protein ACK41C_07220 [Phenylobacterium sp.]|uniref:hypothetical protein n=1 Tax=Phenylobacterium sp. TaxID=1871053 RepID=UPI00391C17F6
MKPENHCETALLRLQRIVTLASRDDAPITAREAFEQMVEELELAGFGSPELDAELLADTAARH